MTSGAVSPGDLGGEGVQRLLELGERVQLREPGTSCVET